MKNTIQTILICLTTLLASVIIAAGLGNVIKEKRTVSVRGLAEREVPADMAVWKLQFSLGGNDLPSLQKEIISKTTFNETILKDGDVVEVVSFVSVPFITVMGIYSMCEAIEQGGGLQHVFGLSTGSITIFTAISIVVGSFISGGTCIPNFSRFARSNKISVITVAIAFFIGNNLSFIRLVYAVNQ